MAMRLPGVGSQYLLATPQNYPRAGSQNYPSPAADANADGSTTVYFGPRQPAGAQAKAPSEGVADWLGAAISARVSRKWCPRI